MRAFLVAGRALRSFLGELTFLVGMSLLWFATGGIAVIAAALVGYPMAMMSGPWWLAPLLTIPIGPATAALAVVARRCAADLRVTRTFYMDGLRNYWRPALGLSAIGMAVLALLLINITFYASRPNGFMQGLTLIWGYLLVFWLSVQLYAYSVLVRMEKPRALGALRTAVLGALANPLFSIVLVLIAAIFTVLGLLTIIFFSDLASADGATGGTLVQAVPGAGRGQGRGLNSFVISSAANCGHSTRSPARVATSFRTGLGHLSDASCGITSIGQRLGQARSVSRCHRRQDRARHDRPQRIQPELPAEPYTILRHRDCIQVHRDPAPRGSRHFKQPCHHAAFGRVVHRMHFGNLCGQQRRRDHADARILQVSLGAGDECFRVAAGAQYVRRAPAR